MSLGRLPLPDPLYFRSLTLPNVNAVDFLSIRYMRCILPPAVTPCGSRSTGQWPCASYQFRRCQHISWALDVHELGVKSLHCQADRRRIGWLFYWLFVHRYCSVLVMSREIDTKGFSPTTVSAALWIGNNHADLQLGLQRTNVNASIA